MASSNSQNNNETMDPMLDLESVIIQESTPADLEPDIIQESKILRTTRMSNKPSPGMWLVPRKQEVCCIYRVPERIRRVNAEAYTPQLLIIGPLHHSLKSQALKSREDITNTKSVGYLNMEKHKRFYLAEFAQRFERDEGEKTLIDGFRRIIEEDEEIIRASYSESTTWIPSQEFVDMILLDSVFILEFFLRTSARRPTTRSPTTTRPMTKTQCSMPFSRPTARCNLYSVCSIPFSRPTKTGDPLSEELCLEATVTDDLILLENQLPYFILEKLFDPIVPTLAPGQTLRKLVIAHFGFEGKMRDDSNFIHFTDLVRLVRVDSLPEHARECANHMKFMYNADKLDSGGVKFEVKEELPMYVSFENGCLKMPFLEVEDKVEMTLRNVMALEQCHYPFNTHICDYVLFLDYLIDTYKDVNLLVEKGIIQNRIGDPSLVAEMVNKLGLGIVDCGSYYSDIAKKVKNYYENPVNRSRAILKRVYFGNLWTGTATIAATLLLLMTLTQTVASIVQIMQN